MKPSCFVTHGSFKKLVCFHNAMDRDVAIMCTELYRAIFITRPADRTASVTNIDQLFLCVIVAQHQLAIVEATHHGSLALLAFAPGSECDTVTTEAIT